MNKKYNKYVFKYNQDDELYNYVELNSSDKVESYFKVEGRTVIRFDKRSKTKQLITFKKDIHLKQKFQANESFLTVYDAENDKCIQYDTPEMEKNIKIVKDNICISDYGKYIVEKWRKMKNKLLLNPHEEIIKLPYKHYHIDLLSRRHSRLSL